MKESKENKSIEISISKIKATSTVDIKKLRDTEQAVLNYMLLSFEKYKYVKDNLKEGDFTFTVHEYIYNALYSLEKFIIKESNKKFDVKFINFFIKTVAKLLSDDKVVKKTSILNILSKAPSTDIANDLNLLLFYSIEKVQAEKNYTDGDNVIHFEFEDLNSFTKATFVEDRLIKVETTNIEHIPDELYDTADNTIKFLTEGNMQDPDMKYSFYPPNKESNGLMKFCIQKDVLKITKRQELKEDSISSLFQWADKYNLDEETFPRDLEKLTNLVELNISNKGIKELPKELILLEKLVVLDAAFNNIKEVPKEFENLRSLCMIILESNEIPEIPEVILNKKNLIFLSLKANKIKTIPSNISNLKILNSLCLCCNNIDKIPNELTKLKNLSSFCIHGNRLKSIPKDIVNLNKLKRLAFSNNYVKSFPKDLQKLKELEELEFENNLIENLDKDIFKLPNLKQLTFDDNLFNSNIDDIKKLNMDTLNITHSKLFDDSSNILKNLPFTFEETAYWVDEEDRRENGCVKLSNE
ncbi:MAG: hypothetical protein CL623_05855 [Arcobacter sp.]|nr:hypothetical protein [Arcobacter sp.]|tara:strand:- start:5890 stop:7470 length:1581 start_codon:yes stop_codon:yes gene_type:complete